MKRNLKIKAIQYNTDELYKTLDLLSDGLSIVYSNLKSIINFNGEPIKTRKFDTMLYNEKDNLAILLMRGGEVTKEDIIEYLEMYEKHYVEVIFEENNFEYKDGNNLPNLCFVNNKKDLCDELIEIIMNNSTNNCIYYPFVRSVLDLGYMSKYGQRFSIERGMYNCILKFNNKIIVISDMLTQENTINILKSFCINFEIDYSRKPDLYVDNFKEKVKQLKYRK